MGEFEIESEDGIKSEIIPEDFRSSDFLKWPEKISHKN